MLPASVAGRSALGDLIEEYHRRPRGLRRRVWFWAITLEIIARYVPERLTALTGGFGRDLTYSVRLARRSPWLALASLVSLSLAIGAGTAAFTIANGTWLRRTLAADPAVVATWRRHKNGASKTWPAAELSALRDEVRLRTIEAASPATLRVGPSADSAAQEPRRVLFVTGTYLSTFSGQAARGRLLDARDERPDAAPVAVLDHLYWRRTFGSDARVLGQIIWIGGSPFTVVGVADREFVDPSHEPAAVWLPVSALSTLVPTSPRLLLISRLRPGVDFTQADAEIDAVITRVGVTTAGVPAFTRAESSLVTSNDEMAADRLVLLSLASVITLMLVLACANVSNLQLAGAASRRQEVAIRVSCGAGRRRVMRQLVTENLAMAIVAGAIGFAVARWLAPLMSVGVNMSVPDLDPDVRIYGFVALVTVLAGVGTGLAPAVQGSRGDVLPDLKSVRRTQAGRNRSSRTKTIFIAVQAAASIVIVAMAALLIRTMLHLNWLPPGYDVDKLLNVSASFPRTEEGGARATTFWAQAVERVRALPGVEAATLAYAPPYGITLGNPDQLLVNSTDERYFSTLGLRLIAGRLYTSDEVASKAPVMLISERVAREYWRDENPVGENAARLDRNFASDVIIGVVADAMNFRVHDRRASIVYKPGIWPYAQLTVRASEPRRMLTVISDAVRAGSADVRPNALVIADRYARDLQAPRRAAGLAAAVAILAMVLSVVGLSGASMFAVRTRTREIGIRLALGARGTDVIGLFIRDSLRPVLIGLVTGLGVALLAGRLVAGMLYGLSGHDPLALIGAVSVLLLAALAAVLLPTRRAARLDPAIVLRDS
jgi:predicted permease